MLLTITRSMRARHRYSFAIQLNEYLNLNAMKCFFCCIAVYFVTGFDCVVSVIPCVHVESPIRCTQFDLSVCLLNERAKM